MQEPMNYEGLSSLGQDIKNARKAKGLSRKALAEMVGIVPRYLTNIENSGSLPSLPVLYDLVNVCSLPVEKYFYPQIEDDGEPQRQRIAQKLRLCNPRYLSVIEVGIDELLKVNDNTEAK